MTKTEKAQQTRQEKKATYASQTISIDKDWKIVRADELNWEIQFQNHFKGYFPTVSSALKALPAKMLSESASGTLADVLRRQEGIMQLIEKALP